MTTPSTQDLILNISNRIFDGINETTNKVAPQALHALIAYRRTQAMVTLVTDAVSIIGMVAIVAILLTICWQTSKIKDDDGGPRLITITTGVVGGFLSFAFLFVVGNMVEDIGDIVPAFSNDAALGSVIMDTIKSFH